MRGGARPAVALALSVALAGCAAGGAMPLADDGAREAPWPDASLAATGEGRGPAEGPSQPMERSASPAAFALGPPGPGGRRDGRIAGAGGAPLALSAWGGPRPAAVIVALHGYGDHAASTFAGAAEAWAASGLRVYAYDQRGFGRNPSRGRWPGAARLVADLEAVVPQIRAAHPGVPLVLLGHSMGGGVALAAAAEIGDALSGLVLVAPAIQGGEALGPLRRAAAWLAAAVLPDRRMSGRGLVRIRASDNTAALIGLGRDPVYLRPPSPREILGLVRVMDRAAEAAPRVTVPALLLHGARDQILPAEAVAHVFARLEGPRRRVVYPDGWHLLLRDCAAPEVWRHIAGWVLARARAGARTDSSGGWPPERLCVDAKPGQASSTGSLQADGPLAR